VDLRENEYCEYFDEMNKDDLTSMIGYKLNDLLMKIKNIVA